jgi:hypothetical protein
MTNHPIIPPTDLVQEWRVAASNVPVTLSTDLCGRRDYIDYIATRAAQWAADQELEACIGWLDRNGYFDSAHDLGAARRPKLPSLKEHLLRKLNRIGDVADKYQDTQDAIADLRRALEALPE